MVELKSSSFIPMMIYLKTRGLADCTGISFVDSRRIGQHKTFKELAQRGQCSLGWFFGFKLHIITNDCGGIIDFMLTPANVHDTNPLKMKGFISKFYGKLFGDKGYLSKELFQSLFSNGIHLVTKLRKNMKTKLVTPIQDAFYLRKRAIIDPNDSERAKQTIFDQLKNIFQVEHSRNRSQINYFNNIFSALIAYNFAEKKPSFSYKTVYYFYRKWCKLSVFRMMFETYLEIPKNKLDTEKLKLDGTHSLVKKISRKFRLSI